MRNNYVSLHEHQKELLQRHLEFVFAYNQKVNLTHITSYEKGMVLHVEDSLTGLTEVNNAPAGSLVDIGSGGGYPGIPLAVASGRHTVLLESVRKKAEALELFIKQEKLEETIKVFAKRSEDYAREEKPGHAVVTARAVCELSELVELAAPLMADNGHLICYKAKPSLEELSRGFKAAEICGLKEVSKRPCLLSDKETRRLLIVFEKIAKPKIELPRRNGMAKKHPLV